MILDAFKCSMYNNNKNTYMKNYFIQIPIFFIIKTNSSKEISPSPFESNSFNVIMKSSSSPFERAIFNSSDDTSPEPSLSNNLNAAYNLSSDVRVLLDIVATIYSVKLISPLLS